MGMSMSRRNMTVGSNSDGADQSLYHKACGCVWLHSHLNIVVSSSCICVNLLVWTHALFMHSDKHPKVGREGNFCSHPVHPSYTLPNTFVLHMVHVSWSTVAPYSPCAVDLVLLTLISLFILDRTVEKAVLCYI